MKYCTVLASTRSNHTLQSNSLSAQRIQMKIVVWQIFYVHSSSSFAILDTVEQGSPHLGRETFRFGSQNNLNLLFKFAILIRQNKFNNLLFYMLNFVQFCARKLPLSIVLKRLIFMKFFPHNYMLTNVWVARI